VKITKLELENFRVFYGSHTIEFSHDDEAPITIIIGENGAGKTNILNAIYWIFTGQFTAKFEEPTNLVNKDALDQGEKKCRARIEFIEQGQRVRAERVFYHTSKESRLAVFKLSENYEADPIPQALGANYLENFLPKSLASWFILDGEAFDKIQLAGSAKFKTDLIRTFGFSTLVELRKNLELIIKEYNKEEIRQSKNKNLEELAERIENLEVLESSIEKRIISLHEIIDENDKQFEARSLELRNMDQSDVIQRRLDKSEIELKLVTNQRKQLESERNSFVATTGLHVLLNEKVATLDAGFREKEKTQQLPFPYGERLIDDILGDGKCICGRPVHADSDEARCLSEKRKEANKPLMSERISELRVFLTTIYSGAESYDLRIKRFIEELGDKEAKIAQLEQEVREFNAQLQGIPIEKIQEISRRRNEARDKANKAREDKGFQQRALSDARTEKDELIAKKEAALSQLTRSTKLVREKARIESYLEYINSEFSRQESEVLRALSAEVGESLRKYLTKNFSVEVDKDTYEIKAIDLDGRKVPLSTGETAVLKFAVLSALVGMAAQKTEIGKVRWISQPVIAPLVFDAPFSGNDAGYRLSIANNLSASCGQLILMFDADKWMSENMAEGIRAKVGRFYTLISRAKGGIKATQKYLLHAGVRINLNEYESARDDTICKEQRI
jgi:DNA sulfur modification protein DndD